jgi:hypothetical protein
MAEKATIPIPDSIVSILQEDRKFACPAPFAEQAHVKSLEEYERLYRESVEEPDKFWGRVANELHWSRNGIPCLSGTTLGLSGFRVVT